MTSPLPAAAPPRKRRSLMTQIVTQGPFCAPECPNKKPNVGCIAQEEPETLVLSNHFELYRRTNYCKENAK
jgi:hypothetical protein